MTTARFLALAPLGLLLAGCVTTSTTTRTWGEPYQPALQYGWVERITETVQTQQGDPAGGAAAGAVVGGLLGAAIDDGPGGLIVGALGGAMVGAAASQGTAQQVFYDVTVRFEEGYVRTFRYEGALPFKVGDEVSWDGRRLARI